MTDETDVVPGEGGEAPMSSTGGDTGVLSTDTFDTDYDFGDYGTAAIGATKGIATLQLEVEILSSAAIDEVAAEIAHRVVDKLRRTGIKTVTVVSPAVLAFLRLHAALEAELDALEAVANGVASAPPPAPIQTEDTEAFAAPVYAAAADTVRRAATSAAAAARIFAVTTNYSGRANVVRQSAVDASLAKHLAKHGLTVEVPEHSLPANESRGLIARMLALQAKCRELQQSGNTADALSQVLASVENLLSMLFGTGDTGAAGAVIAQQLMLAEGVARGMGEGKAVLFAEIAYSGGSYRTRKWIFNFLMGRDGLTYSGGAGVTFFLFNALDRSTLDSDTIYFASPHGRFHHGWIHGFRPTNIGRGPRERR